MHERRFEGLAAEEPGVLFAGDGIGVSAGELASSPSIHLIIPAIETDRGAVQARLKRLLDLVLSALALILLAPLLAVLMIVIRIDSPGPAIFRQRRVGLSGRSFEILKLRTMQVGAESERAQLSALNVYQDARIFKIPRDPRITRIGWFLRRTSLDEVPQFWNVLRGEMSLVGPRPPLPEEVRHYDRPNLERLSVLPGITGPWQVAGRGKQLGFDEICALELAYMRDWSLVSDLRILVRTIPAVLFMRGAH